MVLSTSCLSVARNCCILWKGHLLVLSITVCLYIYCMHHFVACCFVTILLVEVIPHKTVFLELVFIRL